MRRTRGQPMRSRVAERSLRRRPAALAAAGAMAALLVLAALAFGATGELTPQGCISDVGDPAGCGTTQQGLGGAGGVAVAPDGRSVYVGSVGDNAIARFDRDPTTGALTPAGCISDVTDPAGCGTTEQGLSSAFGVAVSPDGSSVYAASEADSAIVRFGRDSATGALTGQGCIEDPDDPAGCAAAAQGLRNARGVAVSPDGLSVYVVSSDPAIVRFDRDLMTGSLAAIGCISDVGDPAACGTTQQGLAGAQAVAVSPDGRSVYVASFNDDAIARFDRDPASGSLTLTPAGCVSDAGDPAGCGVTQQGLDGARGVAVAPDGRSVYVAAETDDAIARFDRDPTTGALAPAGCISDVTDPAGCGTTQQGLDRARGVAVASDGRSVYVASGLDSAIARFDRDPATGALAPAGCISDVTDPAGCGTTQQGLGSARTAAISSDDGSVYVASADDSAIVRFDREPPGTPPGTTPPATTPPDTIPPSLTLKAKRRQSSPKVIVVKASCDEGCTVEAEGTIKVPISNGRNAEPRGASTKVKRFKLRGASATLVAGETAKLRLKNKNQAKTKLKRALNANRTAKAKLTATAADAFGNASATEKAKVRVKKQ